MTTVAPADDRGVRRGSFDDHPLLRCQDCLENLTGTVMKPRQRNRRDLEKVSVTPTCARATRTACRGALAATRTRVRLEEQHDRPIAAQYLNDAVTRVTDPG